MEKEIKLSQKQIELLLMSEDDIKQGKIIAEDELKKMDDDLFNSFDLNSSQKSTFTSL